MKLPQITPKQLIYKNIYGYDRLYSKLILSDTDWMTYILKAIFTVRKHGKMIAFLMQSILYWTFIIK